MRAAVRGWVLTGVAALLPLVAACSGTPAGRPEGGTAQPGAATATDLAERGKYLVEGVGGCNDCHTPMKMGPNGPEPDMSVAPSGHPAGLQMPPAPPASGPWVWHGSATNTAYAGPWGVSYAINLTPDESTGIGTWTEQVFVNALKTQINYTNASDTDHVNIRFLRNIVCWEDDDWQDNRLKRGLEIISLKDELEKLL